MHVEQGSGSINMVNAVTPSGFSPGLSDHKDALEVKSRTHLVAEEDKRNEEAYIME